MNNNIQIAVINQLLEKAGMIALMILEKTEGGKSCSSFMSVYMYEDLLKMVKEFNGFCESSTTYVVFFEEGSLIYKKLERARIDSDEKLFVHAIESCLKFFGNVKMRFFNKKPYEDITTEKMWNEITNMAR